MVYFLYGLGLTAVLWLFVHDNPGALLQADFILWWLIVSGFLLACCSKLPCRLCRLIPGSLGASCKSLSCSTDYSADEYHPEPEGKPAP
jgi:hypothetical protein